MGMYSLIEDARMKALDAANCWHESEEAKALLAKVDAYERQSDRWYSECSPAALGFAEAARDAEDELETLRSETVCRSARAIAGGEYGDGYDEAWEECDNDAPPVSQVVQDARSTHAGDSYIESLAA